MPLLDWLNKPASLQTARHVPYRLLECIPALGYGAMPNPNLLIQGDNLEALKALLPLYAGRIKCIYIDPPYNTRSAFEHYDDNLEHSQWLSMMYPRLELLRDLLAEDGSLWVSIDDHEGHYLKVMLDEIFGRKNFIANVVWQKRISPDNDATFLSGTSDHIVVMSKDISRCTMNRLPRTEEQDDRYQNVDNDPRGIWTSSDLTRREYRERDYYPIKLPSGREVLPARGRSWSIPRDSFETLIRENRIYFGPNGDAMPRRKRFLTEIRGGLVPTTWWSGDVAKNEDGKRELKALFPEERNVFATPKPERLIERILHIATNPGDWVLDSFLGSGTTAAVAHKMGRHYIGVEMGDHAVTHCQPRLQKVVDGEQGGISKAVNWQGGGGFTFCRLGATVFDEYGMIDKAIRFPTLAAYIWYLETRTPWIAPDTLSPLLGIHDGTAYYLLYNGILGDRRPQGGNVLTQTVLDGLPKHPGKRVIYGETSRFGAGRLAAEGITFKQIPYDVRVG